MPIHIGGGLIKSHFWLEIPLKLDHQTIQIKALVCESVCPFRTDIYGTIVSVARLCIPQTIHSTDLSTTYSQK